MYKRLVLLTTLLALCVVVLGAYVRLSGAGLGCPDWPGCYGRISPHHAADEIAQAVAVLPDGPVSTPKAWKEMTHRYFAATLGLLIAIIALWAWRKRGTLIQSPVLPVVLLGLVIFQALLGMWTVTERLKPFIVSAHLLGGMITLALLVWLAMRQFSGRYRIDRASVGNLRGWAGLGLLQQDPAAWLGYGVQDGLDSAAIDKLLQERLDARKEKNFARADEIRKQLSAMGIEIEDTPGGTKWRKAS